LRNWKVKNIDHLKKKEVSKLTLSKVKFSLVVSLFTISMLLGGFGLFSNMSSSVVSFVPAAQASGAEAAEETEAKDSPVAVQVAKVQASGVKYAAAGLCVAICGFATAFAQSKIGAAGAGVIAERPEAAAMCIVLLAIPETIVILGFVVAAMLIVM